jgi:hypothetical protein
MNQDILRNSNYKINLKIKTHFLDLIIHWERNILSLPIYCKPYQEISQLIMIRATYTNINYQHTGLLGFLDFSIVRYSRESFRIYL